MQNFAYFQHVDSGSCQTLLVLQFVIKFANIWAQYSIVGFFWDTIKFIHFARLLRLDLFVQTGYDLIITARAQRRLSAASLAIDRQRRDYSRHIVHLFHCSTSKRLLLINQFVRQLLHSIVVVTLWLNPLGHKGRPQILRQKQVNTPEPKITPKKDLDNRKCASLLFHSVSDAAYLYMCWIFANPDVSLLISICLAIIEASIVRFLIHITQLIVDVNMMLTWQILTELCLC